jgi:hypothetical protein
VYPFKIGLLSFCEVGLEEEEEDIMILWVFSGFVLEGGEGVGGGRGRWVLAMGCFQEAMASV